MTFQLVHTGETQYVTSGTPSTDVNRFRNTNDGFMDHVHAERNAVGADLMALVVAPGSPYCGIADSIMCNESVGFRVNAFSVTIRTCFSGHTFTHELGHTQGCAHDRANAGCGCFNYSYGGRNPAQTIRSIMSYSPGQRVNYWSNSLRNGQIIGGANDDNTFTMISYNIQMNPDNGEFKAERAKALGPLLAAQDVDAIGLQEYFVPTYTKHISEAMSEKWHESKMDEVGWFSSYN